LSYYAPKYNKTKVYKNFSAELKLLGWYQKLREQSLCQSLTSTESQ